jgi:hypothetical protein
MPVDSMRPAAWMLATRVEIDHRRIHGTRAPHSSGHRQGDLAPPPSPLHFDGESRVDRFVEDPIHILAQLRGVRVVGSPWLLRRRVQRSHVAC